MKLESEIEQELLTSKKLEEELEAICKDTDLTIIEAIVHYSNLNSIDIEDLIPTIKNSKVLLEKIEYEAINSGRIKQRTKSILNLF